MATILNRYDSIMAMNVCGMIEFAEDPMKREGAELISDIE